MTDKRRLSISEDGPHEITDTRRWLARQLLDSRLTDEEAFGAIHYHPAILALSAAPERVEGGGWEGSSSSSPSPAASAKSSGEGSGLSHDAAIDALCGCAATVTVLSYQEAIEGYFKLRGLPVPA